MKGTVSGMGFSFRNLYTEDVYSGQGIAADPARPAPGAIAEQAGFGTPKSAPSGIPGPLAGQAGQTAVQTAATPRAPKHQSAEPAFYSLDALEPEPDPKEAPAPPCGNGTLGCPAPMAPSPQLASADLRAAEIKLRAVFGSEGSFDLERVATLTVRLPGICSCIIQTPGQAVLATAEPETVHPIEPAGDLPQIEPLRHYCKLLGVGEVDGILLRSQTGPASFFSFAGVSLIARHSSENLAPGLWEKLILITQATAGLSQSGK